MKQIVTWLLLLVPTLTFSQLTFNYDPETNLLTIEVDKCNICLLGTQENVDKCNCHNDCDETLQQVQEEWEECKDYWEYMVNQNQTYNSLEEECGTSPVQSCYGQCGFYPEPFAVESYQYSVSAHYAPIGIDPLAAPESYHTISSSPTFSATIDIPPVSLASPWPNVYYTKNTCYIVQVVINFIDENEQTRQCVLWDFYCVTY